jgi:hypothetical protein
MNQKAKIVWFDSLKGIGEAKSCKSGNLIFLNAHNSFKNTSDCFKLKPDVEISCKTKKTKEGNLFGTSVSLV